MTSKWFVSAGVRTDFDGLINTFTATNSVRYEKFAEIWRSMKMPLIFYGRTSERELRQFTEDCFKIAVTFWLPPCNFQCRIGALYLLYGLYNTQLMIPKLKIRITPSQWELVSQFQSDARVQNHLDVDYIFHWLKCNQAFRFVATLSECYPGMPGSKESIALEEKMIRTEQLNDQPSIISELMEADKIAELSTIHDQYHRMKCSLNTPNTAEPHSSMNVIHTNLVQYITKSVAAHEEWRKTGKKPKRKRHDSGLTSESDAESDVEPTTTFAKRHGDARKQIKHKAFSQTAPVARSRRHRRHIGVHLQSSSADTVSESSPEKGRKKGRSSNRSKVHDSKADHSLKKGHKQASGLLSDNNSTKKERCQRNKHKAQSIEEDQCEDEDDDNQNHSGDLRQTLRKALLDMPLLEKDEQKLLQKKTKGSTKQKASTSRTKAKRNTAKESSPSPRKQTPTRKKRKK